MTPEEKKDFIMETLSTIIDRDNEDDVIPNYLEKVKALNIIYDSLIIPKPKFKVGDEVNVIVKEYEQVFDIDSGFMVDYGAPFISKMQGRIEELNHYDHVHKQHYYLVRLKDKKDSAEYEYYPEDELEYNK